VANGNALHRNGRKQAVLGNRDTNVFGRLLTPGLCDANLSEHDGNWAYPLRGRGAEKRKRSRTIDASSLFGALSDAESDHGMSYAKSPIEYRTE